MSEKGCGREISSLRSTDHEDLVENGELKTNHMGAEKNEIESQSLSPHSACALASGFPRPTESMWPYERPRQATEAGSRIAYCSRCWTLNTVHSKAMLPKACS